MRARLLDAVKTAAKVETRLKKRQRGFHYEPAPGFYDVKGSFDRAEKERAAAKLAGLKEALAKFDLLNEVDPVGLLVKHLQERREGFAPIRTNRSGGEPVYWNEKLPRDSLRHSVHHMLNTFGE